MKIYNLNRTAVQKVLKDWTTDRAFDYQALVSFDYAKLNRAKTNLPIQIKNDLDNNVISEQTIEYLETISISISILNDDSNLLLGTPDIIKYKPENFNAKYIKEIYLAFTSPIVEKLYITMDNFPIQYFSNEFIEREEEIQNDPKLKIYSNVKLIVKAMAEMLDMRKRFNKLNPDRVKNIYEINDKQ